LKWSDHVKHISAKASRVLNYLRHTLFASPSTVKAATYNCLVRPILEYAAPAWYLYSARDTDQLEAIQRRAARWACGSRWNPQTCCWSQSSTSCLNDLQWPSLHSRQLYLTVVQIHDKRVSIPFNSFFKFSNNFTRSHSLSISVISSTINAYRYSFFC